MYVNVCTCMYMYVCKSHRRNRNMLICVIKIYGMAWFTVRIESTSREIVVLFSNPRLRTELDTKLYTYVRPSIFIIRFFQSSSCVQNWSLLIFAMQSVFINQTEHEL